MSSDELPRLEAWLEGLMGPGHGRRAVVFRGDRVVLSKVAPGLPAAVLAAVERVPALFAPSALWGAAPPGAGGVLAWRGAVTRVLAAARDAGDIDDASLAAIRVGVDSVEALLASCCWTDDGTPGWVPSTAERTALAEAAENLEPGNDSLFSRFYGLFESRRVESHCPGAPIARRIFDAARQFLEEGDRSHVSLPGSGRDRTMNESGPVV